MENCVDKQLVEDRLKETGQNTSDEKIIVQMGSTLKRFGTTVMFKEDACDLYLWGGGSRGKLGHKEDEKELWPRVVEALLGKNITMVACGMAHTMALSSELVFSLSPCILPSIFLLWLPFPGSKVKEWCLRGELGRMANWATETSVIATLL